MRNNLLGRSLLATALTLASGLVFAQTYTLRYAHFDTPSLLGATHVAGLSLKNFLESRSKGRIKVEIYPDSRRGDFQAMMEGVNLGTLELTTTTVGGANRFFPQLQVTDIPYLYRDDLVAETVAQSEFFDDVRDAVLKKSGNLRLVAVGNTGRWRSFMTTKKQIRSAADLKGVKIRTIDSPLQMEMVRFLGGDPIPVVWSDVYDALATGVVEGTKNSATDTVARNMHETLGFMVMDKHAYLHAFWWVGDAWLKSLPEDLRVLVVDGVQQAAALQQAFTKYLDFVMTKKFVEAGGIIYVPTADEKATFTAAKPAMRQWFIDNVEDGELWYNKLEKVIRKTESEIDAKRARVLD